MRVMQRPIWLLGCVVCIYGSMLAGSDYILAFNTLNAFFLGA